ncbi:MAG: PucR family transcriptional regulator [Pseudonocardiales bacterium]|nr:MAG: PucR family transcriptional regulator [Pseudonocardiales bacterium]
MSLRSPTLGRVLEHLGTTVLDLCAGDVAGACDVGGVVIHDPLDEMHLPPGALVLGVGVHGADAVAELIEQLGAAGACALVLREPVPEDEAVHDAAARTGVVLLGLVRGAAWTQLASLLHALLADDQLGDADAPDTIAGLPAGDLFAVANAVSALLDAPVTIEDRSSRVLAFSGRQDEADSSRAETILGRQVPERYARVLEDRGAFHDLYRGDRPIFIDLSDLDLMPRAAVAVRAGDEILGSIWAAVHQPLAPAREQAFRDAANIVALHMLRLRAGADVQRRLRADLVATALEGGSSAPAALDRLGLSRRPTVVLALALSDVVGDATLSAAAFETTRDNAADALSVHLSAVHANSAVALLGAVAYGIVPVVGDPGTGEARAARAASDFLERTGDRVHGVIGIGRVATSVEALSVSRADADRVLRVLLSGHCERVVARLADVHTEVLLLELAALAQNDGHATSEAVGRLLAYDIAHQTDLVASLQTWLDRLGDAGAAAAARHVHVNTFRYRLRRIAEIAEIDLGDPDTRFALMLELRLLDRAPGS